MRREQTSKQLAYQERRHRAWLERERRETAFHEAGHVVEGLLQGGCRFDAVELDPPDDQWRAGIVWSHRVRHGAGVPVSLAGDAATFILTGKRAPKFWNEPDTDWTQAEAMVRSSNPTMKDASRRAVLLHLNREFEFVVRDLRDHQAWSAIEGIAAALLQHRRLTFEDCVRIACAFGIGPAAGERAS